MSEPVEPRAALLAAAHYNPLRIAAADVEFDLKTDSWAQLRLPAIDARMRQLQARLQGEADEHAALRAIFPFEHFVLADSGRSAEQALYRAWPRKGRVLQNLLFPSNIFHQIDNGFDPRELPCAALFRVDADEPARGEVDLDALAAALDRDAGAVAMAVVEIANNAAGGSAITVEHLQSIRALLAPHAIPLVLDATRVVDNACLLVRRDAACAGRDVWSVVRELLGCADVVVASLAKNFGVNLGGLIATRDAALYRDARAAMEQAGTGLDAFERRRIALALREPGFVEAQVAGRVDAVATIGRALAARGAPVVGPPGGHCVLLDVKRIDAFAALPLPVPSFLAWLYRETGIRAGAHGVGMQRRRETKGLVRLAIPLGLAAEDVATIAARLDAAFAQLRDTGGRDVPELAPADAARGGFGELDAEYRLERPHRASVVEPAAAPAPAPSPPIPNETPQTPAPESPSTMSATNDLDARDARRPCDIAIVGMAGRYPKARNLAEFWQNLRDGRDCIEDLPAERLAQRLRYGPAAKYRGGFIDDVDRFDSLFFNIPPKDAERLDPQERLFAEVAWEALEDAGYYPELLDRDGASNVGVFVGAVWACYQTVGVDEKRLGGTAAPSSFLWSIANRVSYAMNFSGPSLTVDTACSSSLTALYLACEAIQSGECSAAIVGGVNLDLHQNKWDINWSGGALSKDGVCRTFGQGANGYVAGEGVGAVYVKPLERALADGDHVYGVIKGVVVNHGGRTSGFIVPNPKAQTNVIRAALERAQVDAASIGYVEAHGTGTELGDPLEIAALGNAFAGAVPAQSCAVGSLKTNIGHLEAAAGVASLTKVLLQMQHRELVPSLHSAVLNEHIDFASSPFRVQQQLEPWQPKAIDGTELPLRAGISSFG
ncbi:MAG TPA: beta-ketoacyl synthase N-terminal-like domain-containing protein, partial [Xanthomonadales bacterium]|nr:beta-ketoacyl synthase N-terminal-like domain-containing protein [Xanthomonadales bacterium]